jgi:DnaK suppressor protein
MTSKDNARYQALKEMMESRASELRQGLRAMLSGPADPVEVRDPETCRRIDDALQRLEQGTYGSCEECDEEIPAARLSALPFATLCITCQELQEESPTYERRSLPSAWVSPTTH